MKEYLILIKIVEQKRNKLISKRNNKFVSKSLVNKYLNKYNELLLKLYSKYIDNN